MDWMHVAQDGDQWMALVIAVVFSWRWAANGISWGTTFKIDWGFSLSCGSYLAV